MASLRINYDDSLISVHDIKSILNQLPGIISIKDKFTLSDVQTTSTEKYSILDLLLSGLAILSALRDENGKIVDFKFEFINEAGCRLNMAPKEAFNNMTLLNFLPSHKDSDIFQTYCNVLETGVAREIESLDFEDYYGGKKLKRAFDINVTKFADGIMVIWQDCTQRKQNEILLKEKAQLSELIEKAPFDAIFIFDVLQQTLVYSNNNFEILTGYTSGDVDSFSNNIMFDLLHPDDIPHTITHLNNLAQSDDDTVLENEYRIKHKSGQYRWMKSRNKVYKRGTDGQLQQIIGIIFDNTKTKVLEEKLLKRDKLIKSFFENSGDGFLLIQGETGIIEDCNQALLKLFGFELVSQVIGRHIGEFHKDLFRDESIINEMLNTLKETGFWAGDYEFIKADNSTFWGNLSMVEIIEFDKLLHFVTIKDITERLNYQNNLEKLTNELKINLELREKFIKVIAHDIRGPFHSMLGLTDIILEDFDIMSKEEIKDYILKVYLSQNNLYSFVNNVLEWAILQSGQYKVKREVFDICSLIHIINDLLEWEYTAKKIRIHFTDNGLCRKINSDLNAVKSIVVNLINNAIKFSYRNSQIEITLSKIEGALKLSVNDSGQGIEKNILKRIFDSKDAYTSIGTENEKGTGLGLSFCIEMSEKLGLKFEIESTPRVGTSVSVIFPEEFVVKE
ncbi:MAG: PAS domain S-box protein [Ignavibacteriaceae bacterium]|nr:PAS domain S-box protein [Ignavibacteriaceae bacterium]